MTPSSPWPPPGGRLCSPAWARPRPGSAGTCPGPAACCHTPPEAAAAGWGGSPLAGGAPGRSVGYPFPALLLLLFLVLRLLLRVGGRGGRPLRLPDIPKWTDTMDAILNPLSHRESLFTRAHRAQRSKHTGGGGGGRGRGVIGSRSEGGRGVSFPLAAPPLTTWVWRWRMTVTQLPEVEKISKDLRWFKLWLEEQRSTDPSSIIAIFYLPNSNAWSLSVKLSNVL